MDERVQDDFVRMLSSTSRLVAPGLQTPPATATLPPVRAIHRLDEALRNKDNQWHRVSAELALILLTAKRTWTMISGGKTLTYRNSAQIGKWSEATPASAPVTISHADRRLVREGKAKM